MSAGSHISRLTGVDLLRDWEARDAGEVEASSEAGEQRAEEARDVEAVVGQQPGTRSRKRGGGRRVYGGKKRVKGIGQLLREREAKLMAQRMMEEEEEEEEEVGPDGEMKRKKRKKKRFQPSVGPRLVVQELPPPGAGQRSRWRKLST